MKKIVLFSLVIIISYFLFGFNSSDPAIPFQNIMQFRNEPVPDVMGHVNILQTDGTSIIINVNETDSFPVFSGFPKNVSGSTFEGGIAFNMDSDPEFEIVYNIGFTVQAWNFDGTNVPGWPQTVSSYPLEGAPAFGDIDGDGQGEIVVSNHGATSGGNIYAFHKNGTNVTGFPINHGYSSRTPVLADLDNNGNLEIIVNKRLTSAGEVWIYKGDGTVYPGWPKSINHVPASSSAVGDITGDGFPEIISESYSSLYAWDRNGNALSGFPFTMPNADVNSYSSPVLADVNGDNIREIVFGTHKLGAGGYVYLLKNDATIMSGLPKPTPYWIYSPPSVGFINADNVLDIAIGDGGGTISFTPTFSLYAWDKNGTALTGFPVGGLWSIDNQVSLGDVDNDNQTELIIDDNTTTSGQGKYLGFNHDGTPMTGNWPIITAGTTFFSTPVLWDLNRDGMLDIGGTGSISSTINVYLWNTGVPFNTPKITIPMWQYNSRHNGVYGDNQLVGITPVSNEIPDRFSLSQNYPNPFNPSTKIRFEIPDDETTNNIQIKVYDILGKETAVLFEQKLQPGTYEVDWNASDYPSGVYFYTLIYNSIKETKKMLLIK